MANHHKSTNNTDHQSPIVVGDYSGSNEAVGLIRQKISRLYSTEPDVKDELTESVNTKPRSKHQEYMYRLSHSGRTVAEIQTDWHKYYAGLSDKEKHEVWQEFYDSQSAFTGQSPSSPAMHATQPIVLAEHKHEAARTKRQRPQDKRSLKQVQTSLMNKVTANGQIKAKHNLQSLAFGLGVGLIVIIIFMFGFFNQLFITPFIQPSSTGSSTPIIVSSSGVAPTSTPEVIIPKINVQIPVDYSETSTNESAIESDLEDGVVHYPTTALPGQNGNAAFFGHSSNNIFNPGKYKFAFVLLHTLVKGDTFYLTYDSKVYVYKVISKTIVSPSDVSVLNPVAGQTATATLITCDPPGTSINRLIVVGQQISPSTSSNTTAVTTNYTSSAHASLPGNGPSLWSRFIGSAGGKILTCMVIIVLATYVIKRLDQRGLLKGRSK